MQARQHFFPEDAADGGGAPDAAHATDAPDARVHLMLCVLHGADNEAPAAPPPPPPPPPAAPVIVLSPALPPPPPPPELPAPQLPAEPQPPEPVAAEAPPQEAAPAPPPEPQEEEPPAAPPAPPPPEEALQTRQSEAAVAAAFELLQQAPADEGAGPKETHVSAPRAVPYRHTAARAEVSSLGWVDLHLQRCFKSPRRALLQLIVTLVHVTSC